MSSVRRLYYAFRSSDGRIRIATLLGVSGLVMALAIFMMLPASAGAGGPSGTENVQPVEVSYGGGSGACAATIPNRLPSAASLELHINNPTDGVFAGSDGTQVEIDVHPEGTGPSMFFDFKVLNNPAMVVYDVVVNGGAKNTHYDYDGNGGPGATRLDTNLHAPTKGGSNNLYSLSHVNICYDVAPPGSVSGIKYHDNDTDGMLDLSEEDVLANWTIGLFTPDGTEVTTTETDLDGSYSFEGVAPGPYLICEATNTTGLPSSEDPRITWAWMQSEPTNTNCDDISGYEPAGYSLTVEDDVTGADFGNHFQVSVDCSGNEPVSVSLGDAGEPQSTVTLPANCDSGTFTSSYDVGLSADGDAWRQFVVFGGDPNGAETIDQVIEWVPEPATYVDGSLLVPTTQVRLTPGGNLQAVVFCSSLTPPGEPNSTTSQCQVSRTISEGEPLDPGEIQLTEVYKFIGDPPNFR